MQRSWFWVTSSIALIVFLSFMLCVSPGSNSKDRDLCGGTGNGYFSIYSPQSGASLKTGSQDSIKWSNSLLTADSFVSLFLYKGTGPLDTIKTNVKNSGYFLWTVPRVPAGDGYRIKVAGAKDTAQFDVSCPFNIISDYSGSLTILKPTAATVCTSGAHLQIQWESKGHPGDSVVLRLCIDTIPTAFITASTGNTGAYAWTIPLSLSTKDNYRIKIASCFAPGISAQSAPFRIVGPGIDAYEPDNIRDSAKTLDPTGKPQYRTLTVNDIDWIKFLADSGKGYKFQITGSAVPFIYYGKDTASIGILQKGTTAADSFIIWSCSGTGAYYLKFSSTKTATEDYSVSLIKNDPLASVVFIAPAASTVWNVGQSYQVQWTPDSALLGKFTNMYLYKGSKQIQSIANNIANSGSYAYAVDPKLESASDFQIRIVNAADTLRGGLSALFTIQGCAPDSFEPDNRRDSASKLVPNGKAQAHTLAMNDTDWVGFNVDSGKVYRLLASGTITPSIRLFYGSASAPSSDSAWSMPGVNVLSLKWVCAKSGTWYARIVQGPTASGCGGYSFEAATIDSLALVTISSPAQGATWAAGSTQQIKWTADTTILGKNANVYLYKGTQQYLAVAYGISNSGICNWSIPHGIVAGGDYRIRIANYSNASLGGYSSLFTISGVTPDAYEPDNIRDSASTLSPLGKAQSHTLPMNDTDWVKFTVDSGASYLLQSSGNIATRVYLFFGSETSYMTYFYSSSTTASLRWTSPKKGVWYARIAAYSSGGAGDAYSFNVSAFDSSTSVNFIAPGKNTTWTAGTSNQIQWTPDSAFLGAFVYLYLYKGSQQIAYISSGSSNSGTFTWYCPAGLSTGSDYRIRISNYSNTALVGFSPYFTINGISPDAYEPDNSRDLASTISPLGKAQSHTLPVNDTDWVKFSADSNHNYMVRYSGSVNSIIYLYFGGEATYSNAFYNTSASSLLQWTCYRSGAWYARISSYSSGNGGGAYTFNVSEFDSLTAVIFSNPTTSSTWSTGSTYVIQWAPDSGILGTYVSAQLYKGGNAILYVNDGPNNGNLSWTVPAGLATGSDYRIKIINSNNDFFCGYSPVFSITGIPPDSYEPDDSIPKASSIATDGTIQNHSFSLGDMDLVRFTAKKDSVYIITATSAGGTLDYINEVLYDSTGGVYFAAQQGSSPTIRWICPQSGTYNIAFLSSDQYGNYSVSVKTYSSGANVGFINPTSLSIWSAGSSYSIQWVPDTALFGQYVQLQLNVDTTMVQLITSSTLNRGSYSWTPPSGIATGSTYVIRLSSYDLPLLYGNSQAFTISGVTPDAYERDNNASISHAMATTGAPENHTLSLRDTDWVNFSATANYLYVLKTTGATSSMSTQLYLYNTDGRTQIATARSTTADSSATILMFCLTSGKYYFRVTSSTTGAYQATATEYDSTKYGLTITKPLAGDSLVIGQADSVKWSSQVSVGGNVDIYLNNSGGGVQTIVANTANSGAYRWTVPSTVTAANDYYIKVISRANARVSGSSGVFKIKAN
jgi:hypothetical protein